jgi:hypothetical protein
MTFDTIPLNIYAGAILLCGNQFKRFLIRPLFIVDNPHVTIPIQAPQSFTEFVFYI